MYKMFNKTVNYNVNDCLSIFKSLIEKDTANTKKSNCSGSSGFDILRLTLKLPELSSKSINLNNTSTVDYQNNTDQNNAHLGILAIIDELGVRVSP